MARVMKGWFEFGGVNSADMGVKIIDAPNDSSGKWRGSQEAVAGRSGYLWVSDGAREQFDIKRKCHVPESKKRAVKAWLAGSGALRFSSEPDAQYDARIIQKIDFKQVCPGEDPIYEFTVTFTCNPDPYIYPQASDFQTAVSGEELPTPAHAYALPRITIVGSGVFSLTIGMQTMFFKDVEDGVIIDSELGDVLTLDGAQLANNWADGELFCIKPGYNVVSFIAGGEDDEGNILPGSVQSVTITPRWRYT